MMNLRLLHPTLPVVIIKEFKNCGERLFRIIHNIGKRSALIVLKEHLSCDRYAWHIIHHFINIIDSLQSKFERTYFEDTNIVSFLPEKNKNNMKKYSVRLKSILWMLLMMKDLRVQRHPKWVIGNRFPWIGEQVDQELVNCGPKISSDSISPNSYNMKLVYHDRDRAVKRSNVVVLRTS